jgi:hypothetical protein
VNDSPVPRTQVDTRPERSPSHGLVWTSTDAAAGSYGSNAPNRLQDQAGDDEHQGDEHLEDRHAGARAPVPPVYGSGRPAFSPPTVLRGRGRRSVHPVSWRPPKGPAAGDR